MRPAATFIVILLQISTQSSHGFPATRHGSSSPSRVASFLTIEDSNGLRCSRSAEGDRARRRREEEEGEEEERRRYHRTRRKRYVLDGSKWGHQSITWRITRRSYKMSSAKQRNALRKAFGTWEESTNLKFLHRSHGPVDISVVFAEGEHGDSNPFDGPSITNAKGNVLAHAFFPRFGGELHFDEAEAWAPGKGVTGTVDLYMVAVHEIGHSLGLKHSSNRHAVMAEYYQQYTGNRIHLHEDDIRGMALLYGDKGTSFKHSGDRDHSLTITSEVAAPRPDICRHATVDGITRLGNGTLYAFRGAWYWKLREEGGIEEGWPRKIEDDWPFEAHIDEIMTDRDGDSYVFKGEQYWLLSPFGHLHHGYPKPIAGLKDMPPSIDAGFIWHGDDQPYFFKKERFWAFNPRDGMGRSWPRTIKQIFQYTDRRPDRIDAALMLNPNESFLFAGTKYWRTTNFRGNMTVVGNPRSIANYWFGCDHKKHLIK